MATVYRVVSVDEAGEETQERFYDAGGSEIPDPRHPRITTTSVPAPRTGRESRERTIGAPADSTSTSAGPTPPPHQLLTSRQWRELLGCTAVFLPADPPRNGRTAFHAPGSGPLPAGVPVEDVDVAVPHGRGARHRSVPAVVRPLHEVLPALSSVHGTDAGQALLEAFPAS